MSFGDHLSCLQTKRTVIVNVNLHINFSIDVNINVNVGECCGMRPRRPLILKVVHHKKVTLVGYVTRVVVRLFFVSEHI